MDAQQLRCVAIYLRYRRRRQGRQFWVHPIVSQRLLKGQFHTLHEDLCEHPEKFFNYYRMSKSSFNELLGILGTKTSYKDTVMRKCVSLEERLSVTLRYLATGSSFSSLHYQYLLGASTIRKIVFEICQALWEFLKESYIPFPTEESWLETSKDFYEKTNFPNCLGAIDGRQIRIQMSPRSGTYHFNYKQHSSVILLAILNSDYGFTCVDIRAYDKSSDSNLLQNSSLGKLLLEDRLNMPGAQLLPHDEGGKPMPFVLMGDAAFATSTHILRPYPSRQIDEKKRIFNYRLSRSRRMVESTFRILANKWGILQRGLDVSLEHSIHVIKAACVLHNFVRKKDGIRFEDTLYAPPFENLPLQGTRGTRYGMQVRDYFANYFASPNGSVQWQYDEV